MVMKKTIKYLHKKKTEAIKKQDWERVLIIRYKISKIEALYKTYLAGCKKVPPPPRF